MRLINVKSLKLESFLELNIPEYAILSHTWGEDEIDFQEWERGPDTAKAGYQKIVKACEQAACWGMLYCWVDTVCIDKTSSAELSEAINSMFAWYKNSEYCLAYLSDVDEDTLDMILQPNSQFRSSKWFTRGWTLQELLAPADIIIYSTNWICLGSLSTRGDDRVADLLTEITGIPVLGWRRHRGTEGLARCSVAQRMSWASNRITTRIEDTAYCLMGIFDVNMPLLYGEGSKAFYRLQEEIAKRYDDDSLFAWCWIPRLGNQVAFRRGAPARRRPLDETYAGAPNFPLRRLRYLLSHPFWTPPQGSSAFAPNPANFYASASVRLDDRLVVVEPFTPSASPVSVTSSGLFATRRIVYSLPSLPQLHPHISAIAGTNKIKFVRTDWGTVCLVLLRCFMEPKDTEQEAAGLFRLCIPVVNILGDIYCRVEHPNHPVPFRELDNLGGTQSFPLYIADGAGRGTSTVDFMRRHGTLDPTMVAADAPGGGLLLTFPYGVLSAFAEFTVYPNAQRHNPSSPRVSQDSWLLGHQLHKGCFCILPDQAAGTALPQRGGGHLVACRPRPHPDALPGASREILGLLFRFLGPWHSGIRQRPTWVCEIIPPAVFEQHGYNVATIYEQRLSKDWTDRTTQEPEVFRPEGVPAGGFQGDGLVVKMGSKVRFSDDPPCDVRVVEIYEESRR